MNSSPSLDDLLEGAIFGIQDELVPNLSNPKAHAAAQMIQSLLQSVRQLLHVYDGYMVEEHNAMTRTLREAASALEGVDGAEADRIRERAATAGQLADLPAPLDKADVSAAHSGLGRAMEASIADLDVIQRAGGEAAARADAALMAIRAHLGPRYYRDMQTLMVGAGFVGRG